MDPGLSTSPNFCRCGFAPHMSGHSLAGCYPTLPVTLQHLRMSTYSITAIINGADNGTRTHMLKLRILSPLCLPISSCRQSVGPHQRAPHMKNQERRRTQFFCRIGWPCAKELHLLYTCITHDCPKTSFGLINMRKKDQWTFRLIVPSCPFLYKREHHRWQRSQTTPVQLPARLSRIIAYCFSLSHLLPLSVLSRSAAAQRS